MKNFGLYIFVFLFIIHRIPIATSYYPSALFAFVVIVLFLLLARYADARQWCLIAPLVLIPFLNLFIGSSSDALGFLQALSGLLQELISILLFEYIRKMNNRMGKFVLLFFLISSFITTITTYYSCVLFPGVIRQIVGNGSRNNEYYMIAQSLNIGNFDFIYEMVLMIPVLICTIKYREVFRKPLIMIASSIVFLFAIFLMLLSAEFTTAIVSAFVCVVISSVMNKGFNVKKLFIMSAFASILFVSFMPMVIDIITYFANNIESTEVSHRLNDIAATFAGEHTSKGSDIDSRQDHYQSSIDAFFAHPFGSWGPLSGGGHSFILDNMAKYGLLGIILIYMYFKSIIKNYIMPFKAHPYYGYVLFVFAVSCVFSIVNPHVYTSFICLYLPLMFEKFSSSNKS